MKFLYGIILCFIPAAISINISTYGQQTKKEKSFVIEFQSEITSQTNLKKEDIFDRLSTFIFGSNEIGFVKPIDQIRVQNNLIVLDQGLYTLLNINFDNKEIVEINFDFQFPSLVSICKFKGNKFLFTDSRLNSVFTINIENEIQKFTTDTLISQPTGIGYIPSKKEIWICETDKHSVSIFNDKGKMINRIGKRGNGDSEFNFPTNIWVDNSENVYVVDALNYRIQIFSNNGEFRSTFGEQGDATGYFARPKDIATDSFGNIYVVDALFHTVQIFNREGDYLSSFGSQGKDIEKFWLPSGIYIDEDDNIYVADSYNSRIQSFKLIRNDHD